MPDIYPTNKMVFNGLKFNVLPCILRPGDAGMICRKFGSDILPLLIILSDFLESKFFFCSKLEFLEKICLLTKN